MSEIAEAQKLVVPLVSLRARLQSGVTWNVVGTTLTQASTFLGNIIIANLLGREIYGEFGIIQSTLVTLTGLAQVAIGYTATKYVAEFRSNDKERAGRILGLCSATSLILACIIGLLLLISGSWLARDVLQAPHLSDELIVAVGAILFSVVNSYQLGALVGLESYHAVARAGAMQGALHIGICSFATWQWGLKGALTALAVSALLRWLIFNVTLKRESRKQGIVFNYRRLWDERAIIFKFAIPIAISSLTTLPALWLGSIFLVRQADGYTQMALFSAAYSLKIMVTFLPGVINNVCISLLNNQKGIGDEGNYRKIFWSSLVLVAGSAVTAAVVMIMLGPWLLRVFGKGFVGGYPILVVLLLSSIPEAFSIALCQAIISKEKMMLFLFAHAVPKDFTLVVLAYLLIPTYLGVGLALAVTLSWTLAMLIDIAILLKLGLSVKAGKSVRYASSLVTE